MELGEMHSGLAVEKRIMGWLGKLEKRLEENRNQIYIQMYINLQKNKTIYIYIYIYKYMKSLVPKCYKRHF